MGIVIWYKQALKYVHKSANLGVETMRRVSRDTNTDKGHGGKNDHNRGRKGVYIMAVSRKTSANVAKVASKVLRAPSTNKPVRKVAASALSQRAPQAKRGKK